MKRILISLMVLCFAMFVATAAGAVTVYGQNDPLVDYPALQGALDTANEVVAEGTFDIGTDILTIANPLKLTTATGATINGSGSKVIDIDLSIAGLVEIDGNNKLLTLNVAQYGIWIDHEEPLADVMIAGCVITGPGAAGEGIANRAIEYNDPLVQQIGDVLITGNEISGFSQAVHLSGWGSLLINNNEMSASYWPVHVGVNFGETEISDNTVYAGWFSGIGPGCADGVQVLRNEVHATGYTYYPIGAGFGATNCVIEDNVIDGNGYFAIGLLYDYHGKLNENNTIKNNDSSEFTGTGHVYIDSDSCNNTVTGNEIGPATFSGIYCVGDSNQIIQNEFRNSGIPGVRDGNQPCVYLNLYADDNTVFEQGDYPPGTGGAVFQVVDNNDGSIPNSIPNRVVGHPADAVAQQEDANPGIGDLLRNLAAEIDAETSQMLEDF